MFNLIFRKLNFALLLILISASIVRCWGIGFGLPNTMARPDESLVVSTSLQFLKGDFNPHFFHWPSLYFYIISGLYYFYYILCIILAKFTTIPNLLADFGKNLSTFFLISRYCSASFGIATVFIVYKIAYRLFEKRIALISALYLSLAYLHVRDSHFGVTDITMTFFIMCSILYIIKCYEYNSINNYVKAGIFAGLATSTKYSGILLMIPIVILNIIKNEKKLIIPMIKPVIIFGIVLMFVFILGTPYAILDYKTFISDFLFIMKHIRQGGLNLGNGWWFHIHFSMFYGIGWSLLLFSILGIFLLFKDDWKKGIILCSFAIIYYIIALKGSLLFVRYSIPLIPTLCITGAYFTNYLYEKIDKYILSHYKIRINLIYVFAILIILPSFYNIIKFDSLLISQDSRVLSAEWVEKNIEHGKSLINIGSPLGKVELNNKLYNEWRYDWKPDNRLLKRILKDSEKKNIFPDIIIYQEYPLLFWNKKDHEIEKFITEHYKIRKTFIVINISAKNKFDQNDAFYYPFAGFNRVKNPGPNIYIYERKEKSN